MSILEVQIPSMQASPIITDLIGKSDAALAAAVAGCPAFQVWASGEPASE